MAITKPIFPVYNSPQRQIPTSRLRRRRFTIIFLTFLCIGFLIIWSRPLSRQYPPPPIILLEDSPRPTVPLTSLGLEADQAYRLGSLSWSDYRSSLESFVNITFPPRLISRLTTSLDIFLDFDSTKPRPQRPRIIWQTNDILPPTKPTRSWKILNEDHEYRFLNDADADYWVRRNFGGSAIEWAWDFMPQPVMKADLLRYLLLLIEGGTYSDIDTTCLKPISRWGFDPDIRGQVSNGHPSAVIGIEADVGDRVDWHRWWSRPIQIVQWTMSFSPGHPALLDTVRRIYAHSVERYRTMHPDTKQAIINMTLEWTGPAVFTDAILRFSRLESDLTWPELRNLTNSLRTGSVTYLPVTGFSPGVGNFGSQQKYDAQAMVYHEFKGSWKPKKGKEHEARKSNPL